MGWNSDSVALYMTWGKPAESWGSEEAVPGPSVFPSGEPGVSGDFWGSQHPGKFPKVPGRRRGTRGFPAAPRPNPGIELVSPALTGGLFTKVYQVLTAI